MKNNINIFGNNQSFQYIIEYSKGSVFTDSDDIYWCKDNNTIRLHQGNVELYRNKNEWYSVNQLQDRNYTCIPEDVSISNIKI